MEAIADHIWRTRYRAGDEATLAETMQRVAHALAAMEPQTQTKWEERFYDVLADLRFLPGGRILAGAGTGREVTLFNCFVMGRIEDSLEGIFRSLKEGAVTMQQGGGVGYDFSPLRPAGAPVRSTGGTASGPVSFMSLWDSMCGAMLSTGVRRGAMMATLRCDHPDIPAFIDAKRDPQALKHFNLSVLATDAFLEAVRTDKEWVLSFEESQIDCHASGRSEVLQVFRRLPARDLWERIVRAAYDVAEPGVLFIDRINRENNLWYRERITATNPCGEIPLPPYGACDLGSINLVRFVREAFTPTAHLDLDEIVETVRVAVRMLDDVIDLSRFPLPRQREEAKATRRIGLGVAGLADALTMLGLGYGEAGARAAAQEVMQIIAETAYATSVELAREKGSFPALDADRYLEAPFITRLPERTRAAIRRSGIRNSHLLAIAPAGTISLLAGNISSGIEPAFDADYVRDVVRPDQSRQQFSLTNHAVREWRLTRGDGEALPPAFVRAQDVPPDAQLEMQAVIQPFVDNAISKTIIVPQEISFDGFRSVFTHAYELGLKGCTAFRPNPTRGAVMSAGEATEAAGVAPHCCSPAREPD